MQTRVVLSVLTISFLCPIPARAQWAANGTGVCTSTAGQFLPAIASDGSGGAIIAWEDFRNSVTSGRDVYVQRVDANGYAQWAAGGIPLCTEVGDQRSLFIVSDGAGGAVAAWADFRNGPATVYAQRVSAGGSMLWTSGGVSLCTAAPEQNFPVAASDGSGGAIVAWWDTRTGGFDIYAQRVDASGAVQWTAAAAPICTITGTQHVPYIIGDGAGGAIMAWTDERGPTIDIYAQRINAAGAVQWTAGGAPVCQAVRVQFGGFLASDGAGGALIAWVDGRLGNSVTLRDIYAQRLNGAGVPQWVFNGVAVCNAPGEQLEPTMVTDEAGGAVIIWHDNRASNWDVYAQRVNGAGVAQWTGNGVALCAAAGTQEYVSNASDGTGGAIATWYDGRDFTGYSDVYAQRIDGAGAVRWAADGVAVGVMPYHQNSPKAISDGASGVIITWDDMRSWDGVQQPVDPYKDIYANRVTASGWSVTGVARAPSARAVMAPNVPNPFSETTSFDLTLDRDTRVGIDVYDVAGRQVRHVDIPHATAGRTTISFDGRDARGRLLPSGTYFYRVSTNDAQFTRKMLILR